MLSARAADKVRGMDGLVQHRITGVVGRIVLLVAVEDCTLKSARVPAVHLCSVGISFRARVVMGTYKDTLKAITSWVIVVSNRPLLNEDQQIGTIFNAQRALERLEIVEDFVPH